MKILVIDDDRLTRKTVEKKLTDSNFEVKSAVDAFEGLSMLDNEIFDLIIADIMMPTISGLSMVSVVKEFGSHKIPIVIISSLKSDQIIQTCKDLGVSEYFPKPIDFNRLIIACKKYSKIPKL